MYAREDAGHRVPTHLTLRVAPSGQPDSQRVGVIGPTANVLRGWVMSKKLTAERLRELLHFDPETGVFRWIAARRGGFAGDVSGCKRSTDGYIVIGIDRKVYMAHRLAWLYMHGEWPSQDIDHINGIRHDNRIVNLREATRSENNQNIRGARSDSISGLLGAHWHKNSGGWYMRIKVGHKSISKGMFATAEEAHAAYLKAKAELHPFSTITETTP